MTLEHHLEIVHTLPSFANSDSPRDPHAWVLGLDVGANSIGWMLVREVPIPGSVNVIGGVRVFPAATATEKNTEKSKTAERRMARGMRRQHDRRSRRRRRLTYVLREIGLLPPKPQPIDHIYKLDPYELRARGLDERLEPHEVARAFIHLAQRRGFQSNRKAAREEKESKKINEQINNLRSEMQAQGCRTVGEFLYKCVPLLRDRRRGRYLHRTMTKEEFERLWEKQRQYYPQLLTDEAKRKVHDAMFYQRPFLKPERLARLVGQCEFEPSEKRARVGHRLVQRFRIAQEVANLRLISLDGAERTLSDKEKAQVREYLEQHLKLEFETDEKRATKLHKLLGLDPGIEINLSRGARRYLKGNEAEIAFAKALGNTWKTLDEEKKNALNELVLEEFDDDRLKERAVKDFGLTPEEAEKLLDITLPDRFGRVSLKAIRNLLPHLEAGKDLHEAIVACGYDKRHQLNRTCDLLPFPPGTRFAPHREKELIEQGLLLPNSTEITNPVVRKALFEVRKVVNAIIKKYGKPIRIVVELAREAKASIEERSKIAEEQRKRKRENDKFRDYLIKQGIPNPSKTDILKYRLWEECGKICPYSKCSPSGNRPVTFEQLFITGEVDIEHILPYSLSLDDSFANKTLCFRDWNQKKGNRTPYEAFAESEPEAYKQMLQRVRNFSSEFRQQKLRRFLQKTVDLDSCIARQLNDTRYISRVVCSYLQTLGVEVRVTRGQVTAALRHHWGLNKILAPDGSEEKNRADHRHHAVDAAVIAVTTPKHLKNLARREDFRRQRDPFPQPWDGFSDEVRKAVQSIIVSYAPTRRVRGPLHEETNYGLVQAGSEKNSDAATYAYRKPVGQLTRNEICKKVRDKRIRDLLIQRLNERMPDWQEQEEQEEKARSSKRNLGKAFPENDPVLLPNKEGDPIPIRKVRLLLNMTNAIGLPTQKPYRYVKPGENHHLEIFEYVEEGKTKWEAIAVTLFEAAQRLRRGEPVVRRTHPTRPDAKFLMSLCKNDTVRVREGGEPWRYYRVQSFSTEEKKSSTDTRRPDISLSPLNLAIQEKKCLRRIGSFQPNFEMQKVNVSVLGEVTPAND